MVKQAELVRILNVADHQKVARLYLLFAPVTAPESETKPVAMEFPVLRIVEVVPDVAEDFRMEARWAIVRYSRPQPMVVGSFSKFHSGPICRKKNICTCETRNRVTLTKPPS